MEIRIIFTAKKLNSLILQINSNNKATATYFIGYEK